MESGLVDRITADLRAKIVSGRIAPGEKLRQDVIAEQYGASSNPVREAFQRLENTGLVVLRPRRGVIASYIRPADACEVSQMRNVLESLALEQAMQVVDGSAVAQARQALEVSGASDEIATWLTTNRAFHLSLYRPCGWTRLLASIEELWLTSDRHLYAVWSSIDYQDKSHAEHQALLDAYEAGDVKTARRILSEHILEAGMTLAGLLGKVIPKNIDDSN